MERCGFGPVFMCGIESWMEGGGKRIARSGAVLPHGHGMARLTVHTSTMFD
jgi:hypothetical protein